MNHEHEEIVKMNKKAWDRYVDNGNHWTVPVNPLEIANARDKGIFQIILTPTIPVPRNWFPETLKDSNVLALASGGGQQAPILAALGANVTVFDNSPKQLARDREVALRENLEMTYIEGDMMDLSQFHNDSFDFIFHPCSNSFIPEVKGVWKECFRLLKKGGLLLSGFCNPIIFTPDFALEKKGIVQLKYPIPYSDLHSISEKEREVYFGKEEPLCFGHSLEDQIGGQLKAGFHLIDFYEDGWNESAGAIHKFLKCYMATKALKP